MTDRSVWIAAVDNAIAEAISEAVTPLNAQINSLQLTVTDLQNKLTVAMETIRVATETIAVDTATILDLQARLAAATVLRPEWPNATNTGAKGPFTPYTGPRNITVAGTVLQNLDLSGGQLVIKAADVVIRNCMFNGTSWYAIRADDPAANNLIVKDCTFKGPGTGATTNTNTAAIYGRGKFVNNDISGFENGISFVDGPASAIGNYIHDLADGGGPHYDGIECHGGQHDILIEGNHVEVLHSQTSTVFLKNDFGPITNVMVRKNRLIGGGYTVYADNTGANGGALTGISFVDNVMGKGTYGYASLRVSTTWTGNVDMNSGNPI